MDTLYDRVEHKYNCQSEVKETKDQNGTIHQFEYDLLGRRTVDKVTLPDPNTFNVDGGVLRIERGYEVRGMVERVTNYSNVNGGALYVVNEVELVYDDFGNLIADHQEHDDAVNQDTLQVQYAHANGAANHARLTAITYPNDRVLHHEYSTGNDNNLSRLSYLSDVDAGGTRLAEYTYLGAGQIVKVDYSQPDLRYNLAYGSGNDPYDGLDRFGRVVDLLWRDYGASSDAVRIKHGYDRASNRLWREDAVAKSQGTPVYLDERYTYDGMYQLAALQRGQLNANEDGLVADSKTFAEQWTLDPLGNWGNFKQDDDGDGDWDLDQNRTHNAANELEEIATSSDNIFHDRVGNMVRAPKPDNWNSHYHLEYDAWNRLVTVYDATETYLVAGYDYDGLNRRVIKETYDAGGSLTEMRHYYYSDQWQVLEERVQQNYGSSGSASAPESLYPERQFVWGLRYVDDLILRDRDTDTNPATGNYGKTASGLEERLYVLQDPNWNVVAIANTSGAIQERYRYDAYGKPKFLSETFGSPSETSSYSWETLFCGYRWDGNVQWYHVRERILRPHLGRWDRKDPIWDDDNPYRYVRNRPTESVDPLGMYLCTCNAVAGFPPHLPIRFPQTAYEYAQGQCRYVPSGATTPPPTYPAWCNRDWLCMRIPCFTRNKYVSVVVRRAPTVLTWALDSTYKTPCP